MLEERVIINALNHEVRREMLRLLHEGPLHASEMQDYQNLPSNALDFHLKQLSGFVEKNDEGEIRITALGERAFMLLDGLCRDFTYEESLLLKIARLVQKYEAELHEATAEKPRIIDTTTILLFACATMIILAIFLQFIFHDSLLLRSIVGLNVPVLIILMARKYEIKNKKRASQVILSG
ncbi:MAG: hypothetical protein ACFFCS_17055 [Candidatus Hodarchaeota archaeon]